MSIAKAAERAGKNAKTGAKEAIAKHELLKRMQAHLDAGNPARSLAPDRRREPQLREYNLITIKPMLYIANVDEAGLKSGNEYLTQVREYAARQKAPRWCRSAPRSKPRSRSSTTPTSSTS